MTPTPAPTGLIDVHAHFVTDSYVAAARSAGVEHPDGMPGWPSWSVEQHLDLMDRSGIEKSYLSISSPGVHFGDDDAARSLAREVNESGARVRAERPQRFGHFASLPLPDVEGSLAEVAHALDVLRADGVAVETNHHGVYLGDPRFEPLWEDLDRRGALVFVHPTSPPNADDVSLGRPRPMLEFLFDTARTAGDLLLRGVLTRYPRIRWVLTHGGERCRCSPTASTCSAPCSVAATRTRPAPWSSSAASGTTWPAHPSRAKSRPWTARSAPSASCTAVTTAGHLPRSPRPGCLRRLGGAAFRHRYLAGPHDPQRASPLRRMTAAQARTPR